MQGAGCVTPVYALHSILVDKSIVLGEVTHYLNLPLWKIFFEAVEELGLLVMYELMVSEDVQLIYKFVDKLTDCISVSHKFCPVSGFPLFEGDALYV